MTGVDDSWDGGQEKDPYDNYSDVRREMRGKTQARPNMDQMVAEAFEPEQSLDDQISQVIPEAIKRIEQAKLYETLLKHNLFSDGSARPEIVDAVQMEIRNFVLMRLEELLGMRQQRAAVVAPEAQFDNEEVSALKALASRVLQRKAPEPAVTNPQIKPVGMIQQPNTVQVAPITPTVQPTASQAARKGRPRKMAAVNPANKPKAMPSVEAQNMLAAQQAAMNAQKIGANNALLQSLINVSVAKAATLPPEPEERG